MREEERRRGLFKVNEKKNSHSKQTQRRTTKKTMISPSQCRLAASSVRAAPCARATTGPCASISWNGRVDRASIGQLRRHQRSHARLSSSSSFSSSTTTTSASASASSSSAAAAATAAAATTIDLLSSLITPSTIVITGAGIAGVATARALSLVGIDDFVILEKSGAPRAEGTSIGIWTNAWRALDALRVGDELRASWPEMHGIELFDCKGKKLREISINDCKGGPHEARGVGRAALVRSLASKLPSQKMVFGCTVLSARSVKSDGNDGNVEIAVEGLAQPLRCRALVAADGARSTLVQGALNHLSSSSSSSSSSASSSALLKPLRYVGYTAYRGIASFPAEAVPSMLPRDRFRIHFGSGVRAGIVPLGVHTGGVAAMSSGDGTSSSINEGNSGENKEALFYWFTCQNEPNGDKTKITDVALMRADAAKAVSSWNLTSTGISLLQNASAESTWSRAAISDRWLESGKSYGVGAITAVGDAAHPMTVCGVFKTVSSFFSLTSVFSKKLTPFLSRFPSSKIQKTQPNAGQGGCVGLEDAVELARAFKQGRSNNNNNDSLTESLRAFEKKRSTRARWVQVKSFAIGFGGQLDLPLFPLFRDWLLSGLYPIEEFLDLADYDCGGL